MAFPIGDPRSSSYVGYTSLAEFPSGTGLHTDTFTDVITQFLLTRSLSTSVLWVDETNARAGRFIPLRAANRIPGGRGGRARVAGERPTCVAWQDD
jgi:hypothetical protein